MAIDHPYRKAFIGLLVMMAAILALRYGPLLLHPDGLLFTANGDGLKNYYTYLYHVRHDTSPWNFSGMMYPYGEHVFYTDGHPLLSELLRLSGQVAPAAGRYAIGLLNLLMLASIPACAIFLFLLLKDLGVRPWMAAGCAVGITMLAPQVMRMNGHFALSYSVALPSTWYILSRCLRAERGWKWPLVLFLAISWWWWTHAYLGAMTAAFAVLMALCHPLLTLRASRPKAIRRAGVLVAAAGLLPMVLFRWILFLTDHHPDRTTHPSGFFDYMAEPDDLLFPQGGPVRGFWDDVTDHGIRLNWEGSAYIGLAAILVLLAWPVLRGWRWRSHGRSGEPLPAGARVALLAASVLLLFAFGVPFKDWREGILYFPVFEQFRAVGRFTWPFYFVITVICALLLDRWAVRSKGRSKPWLNAFCVVLPLAWVGEGWDQHGWIRRFGQFPNFLAPDTDDPRRVLVQGLNVAGHQAILPLPLFNHGSESFDRPGSGPVVEHTLMTSIHTGLPIVGANLTRVSVPESKRITELVSPSWYPKHLRADLPDQRPLLVVHANGELGPAERELLRRAVLLDSLPGFRVYSLALDELFRNTVVEEREHAEALRDRLFLRPEGGWVSDTLVPIVLAYPSHGRLDAAGNYSGPKAGPHPVLDTVLMGVHQGDRMVLSAWFHNAVPDALGLGLFLELVQNGEERTEVRYRVDQSPVIDEAWSMVEMTFIAATDAPRLLMRTDCYSDLLRTIRIKDVLIRKEGTEVQVLETSPSGGTVLFRNGHWIR
ncbi:MAG TPA: hypothetical protein VGE21_12850 [Flavobacteriales bacterium]